MKHIIVLATILLAMASCVEVKSGMTDPSYHDVPLIEKQGSVYFINSAT